MDSNRMAALRRWSEARSGSRVRVSDCTARRTGQRRGDGVGAKRLDEMDVERVMARLKPSRAVMCMLRWKLDGERQALTEAVRAELFGEGERVPAVILRQIAAWWRGAWADFERRFEAEAGWD